MSHFRRGMVTNHLAVREKLERDIICGRLSAQESENGLLLFTNCISHYLLHFYLHSAEGIAEIPELDIPVVCEIAAKKDADTFDKVKNALNELGFKHELKRERLATTSGTGVAANKINCCTASQSDFDEIKSLLFTSFSSLSGCIPPDDELRSDITNGHILICRESSQISALLHFKEDRKSLEIRHLCVAEKYRGRSIATSLVDSFLNMYSDTDKKVTVWVREGYSAAEAVYQKNGFTPDGMTSDVYIKNA